MTTYVHDRTEHSQAERQLLAADFVEYFTSAGHEARQVRLGVYPGVALWCAGGASTVVLVDDDVVQWGRRWQHLCRWRESTTRHVAQRILKTLTVTSRGVAASAGRGERA